MKETFINETSFYSGFGLLSRKGLIAWKDYVIEFVDMDSTHTVMGDINHRLCSNNVIIFFDHHYAFDAVPLGLALGKYVESVQGVLIPYAVHLDMGVGRDGEFSFRYRFRTLAFHWLVRNIIRNNPTIHFLPVVRDFELERPRVREIVDREFRGANTKYLRTFIRLFSKNNCGQVCFLTPFSGIAFPGKPVLHPQLYRSINLVQSASKNDIPFYFVGAYPSWRAYKQYYAPLIAKHKIAVRGPFSLPVGDYKKAKTSIKNQLNSLRNETNFVPPDYDRILNK
jgi:hypothetical protein